MYLSAPVQSLRRMPRSMNEDLASCLLMAQRGANHIMCHSRRARAMHALTAHRFIACVSSSGRAASTTAHGSAALRSKARAGCSRHDRQRMHNSGPPGSCIAVVICADSYISRKCMACRVCSATCTMTRAQARHRSAPMLACRNRPPPACEQCARVRGMPYTSARYSYLRR